MTYDASLVSPHLWVGSAPPPHATLDRFSTWVKCAIEDQLPRGPDFLGTIIRAPLDDNDIRDRKAEEVALAAASRVARYVLQDQDVLVTCFAGLNRSAFVAALAMLEVEYLQHRPIPIAQDVITQIRAARSPAALNNPRFVWLIELRREILRQAQVAQQHVG